MDLEWLYQRAPYSAFENIYLNEEVEIVARSQEHSDIIESCWKKPSTIIEEFDHEAISRFVS